jgi:hypothetical protein
VLASVKSFWETNNTTCKVIAIVWRRNISRCGKEQEQIKDIITKRRPEAGMDDLKPYTLWVLSIEKRTEDKDVACRREDHVDLVDAEHSRHIVECR